MTFTFFTFGGCQLWEDVFFSSKWRIQRNCLTKHYRLLDNWNIRRASGTYEECSRAFNRYAKVFQLPLHKSRAVIMLHGLTGYKEQFNKIAQMCEAQNMTAISLNYPSTRKSMKSHVRQLSFFMDNLKNVNEVCFITKGIGGLIIRKLLSTDGKWKKRIKISKVIQINPINQGYALWECFSQSKFITFLFGELLSYGKKENAKKIPTFPSSIEFGIINTNNRLWNAIRSILPKKLDKFLFKMSDSFLPNASDIKYIQTWRINQLNSKKLILFCKNFLRCGKF